MDIWPAVKDASPIIASVAAIIASATAIITSAIAVRGIDAWRREYTGKKQIELAEEVLSLFYEAQEAIREIRNPFFSQAEVSTRKSNQYEVREQDESTDHAPIILERYQRYYGLFSKLHSLRYRFMVHFGPDAAAPFDDLRKILSRVQSAARTSARLFSRSLKHRDPGAEQPVSPWFENWERLQAILWLEVTEKKDEIDGDLSKVVADIEKTCGEEITGKGIFRRARLRLP